MKNILFIILLCVFINLCTAAQTPSKRSIRFHNLGNDSINLSFNEEYYLIEDSCAQIVRYGHMNLRQRMFFGSFKDISKDYPDIIIAEGNYTNTGLKDGSFITHYLNGALQAKGEYRENKVFGKWEFYYPDGRPKLFFDASTNDIKIKEAWDEKGKKIVDKGNGNFTATAGNIAWAGKLNNGTPDGTWKAMKINDRTNTVLAKEKFKESKFIEGSGIGGDYTDLSRISLLNEADLPFVNAEKIRISPVPCNGVKRKQIVNAQYKEGFQQFSERIKDLVSPCLRTVDLKPYDSELELAGEVSVKGEISRLLHTNAFDDKIASGLERVLTRLPFLEPALADGKPVPQKIVFTFKFT
ncbi:MAG TPA: hypothetical protein VMY77_03615 [Chitinophagaceae bacterium]|nr:hypothetical protein [Chitinophagaceae bacterium]